MDLYLFVGLIAIAFLYFLNKKIELDQDKKADYSNISGEIINCENGDRWFIIPYTKYQTRKRDCALEIYKQGTVVCDTNDFKYRISSLVDTNFYFESDGIKKGPYIVFTLISTLESPQYSNNFHRPIQYVNGDNYGSVTQDNDLEYNIENFTDIMIENGIPLEDIKWLQDNLKDKEVQRTFLSKYENILKGLEMVGYGMTLFELLSKIFWR